MARAPDIQYMAGCGHMADADFLHFRQDNRATQGETIASTTHLMLRTSMSKPARLSILGLLLVWTFSSVPALAETGNPEILPSGLALEDVEKRRLSGLRPRVHRSLDRTRHGPLRRGSFAHADEHHRRAKPDVSARPVGSGRSISSYSSWTSRPDRRESLSRSTDDRCHLRIVACHGRKEVRGVCR